GGNLGFYKDTLMSLAKFTLYAPEKESLIAYSLNIFLTVLIVSCIVSFFYNRTLNSPKSVFTLITTITIISVIMQNALLGTLFLVDRTALFFYPLLIFTLFFCLNDYRDRWYSKLTAGILTVAFILNFIVNANFIKTALWYFDSHSSETLNLLNEIGEKENRKLIIFYSWPVQSSVGYYLKKNKYPFLQVMQETPEKRYKPTADYYIYLTGIVERSWYNPDELHGFFETKTILKQYQKEKLIVYWINQK
ncbi:MAG: hypothetical protein V4580_05250, partial [Bacteroidota bacterium]